MKCSSRRNCNCLDFGEVVGVGGLNEVQLPKELQPIDIIKAISCYEPQ